MREVLLIKRDNGTMTDWADAFAGFDVEVRAWESRAKFPAETVQYALVWQPEAGALAALPNLRVIFSLGVGVDHLLGDNIAPSGIPIVRMMEDGLTAGMNEYVLFHVLRFHRLMPQYEADQRARIWNPLLQVAACDRRVGLLGLGELGGAAAALLAQFGFQVAGWSRTEKNIAGVQSFFGDDQLADFLARTEILICLLPLTAHTERILRADNFAHLPHGAFVINAARGAHCVEADLLAALDSGQVAGAALDVFADEPPPPDSPLWSHPRVHITPHTASMTLPAPSARHVIDNITRLRAGREMRGVVDIARGY